MPTLSYSSHDNIIAAWKATTPKVALCTALPAPDGTSVSEPNFSQGYVRQLITFGATTRGTGSNAGISTIANDIPLVFGPATTSDWPSVIYAALYSNDGTVIHASAQLPSSRTCAVGDSISFGVGAIQFRFK